MLAEEAKLARFVRGGKLFEHEPAEQLGEHRTGRKKPRLQAIQRLPSGKMPPPGAIICTCG